MARVRGMDVDNLPLLDQLIQAREEQENVAAFRQQQQDEFGLQRTNFLNTPYKPLPSNLKPKKKPSSGGYLNAFTTGASREGDITFIRGGHGKYSKYIGYKTDATGKKILYHRSKKDPTWKLMHKGDRVSRKQISRKLRTQFGVNKVSKFVADQAKLSKTGAVFIHALAQVFPRGAPALTKRDGVNALVRVAQLQKRRVSSGNAKPVFTRPKLF